MATQANLISQTGLSVTDADFEGFYRLELPRIYNFFRYRVGGSHVAEDLTSETFEKAWRHRARYRRDLAAFSTWLFTIARRVAQDYYRKHRNEIQLEEMPDLSTHEIMEDLAQRNADFARLSVLLAQLEDRERELVALKYGAGLTNRDLARLSGLSESNVGVILHRTLQILRTKWEAYDER